MTRNTNGKGFSLKDHLFNKKKVQALGERFAGVDTAFDALLFTKTVMQTMCALELKQRIGCITDALKNQLPEDYKKACVIIVDALPGPLDPSKTDDDFGDFIYAPLGEYVVRHGCVADQLDCSLVTLREITMRFSMEDAIRYFLNAFPKETLETMHTWATDDNYHVRRLVSEGTRPLLPWSGRVAIEQKQTLLLLDLLQSDATRYVTRSVANHMNDISKTNASLVLTTLKRWKQEGKQNEKELSWMTRHSLRTLVKQGDADALALLGYRKNPKISVSDTTIYRSTIAIGESLIFSCTITASADAQLMIDYVIDFVKANGKTAPKVYKLKKLTIKKGESILLKKKHRFVQGATTVTFYPGVHTLTLQINGKKYNGNDFMLKQ